MGALLWPALNLLGLLGFVAYKTKGPFFEFVRARRNEIFEGLNKSKARMEEASRRKAEVDARLAKLDWETKAIAAEWIQKSAAQTSAIREASTRVVEQMKAEAGQNKIALVEQTRLAIRASFKRAILQAAEQKIAQSLNSNVHAKVNERLAGEVSRGMNL
jgi:F0F1-type ATP synthase membrane subunit b/b'